MKNKCDLCMMDNVGCEHAISANHLRNKALYDYSQKRKKLTGNRKGIVVTCNVKSSFGQYVDVADAKIKISAKPNEKVKFYFSVMNATKKEDIQLAYAHVPVNKVNFAMNDVQMISFPECLRPKTKSNNEIYVKFEAANIGQYEMPIFFLFENNNTNEKIIITRNMIVFVEENQTMHKKVISPYTQKEVTATEYFKTFAPSNDCKEYRIPKNYKTVFANGMKVGGRASQAMKDIAADLSDIFKTHITKENYIRFFHNLLWYEETIVRINLKKYNMAGVKLTRRHHTYELYVPGLAEKRPSLMLGDLLLVKPQTIDTVFEGVIGELNENTISIKSLHTKFSKCYTNDMLFDIRFFMSRVPIERMHVAVNNILNNSHEAKIFPEENVKIPETKPILDYYNLLVRENQEQRLAVEHIVAGTSGRAPYLLHGPPGTGKTITLVEAVLQLVQKNERNRILICTDSNMAADHVTTRLIKYSHMFDEKNFLLRANSKYRVWETMPECLVPFSNGKSYDTYEFISIDDFMNYRIIVSTLSHSAKYAYDLSRKKMDTKPITHLFIDEAAQASEPSTLIPINGLLQPTGALVLAGDPLQLGPVVISHSARDIGLGQSLMERLKNTCPLYNDERNDSNYMVMLRNNFRSHGDILELPNDLFYKKQLRVHAKEDIISNVDILGEAPSCRAIVFHGVLSKEQKMGKSPSYFNDMEAEIVKKYITLMVTKHGVKQDDIGIITPYIRQGVLGEKLMATDLMMATDEVYKLKRWLIDNELGQIEVGTVEAFQGKEKRVIVISTVRANCGLLDHDAKFQLGFLVDDKRFNVAITRAKAKVIIIGNPLCLEKDEKWRRYIQKCRELGTHRGFDSESLEKESTQQEIFQKITPMLKELVIKKEAK